MPFIYDANGDNFLLWWDSHKIIEVCGTNKYVSSQIEEILFSLVKFSYRGKCKKKFSKYFFTHFSLLFQAYNGHEQALNVLLGYIMNLDICDMNGKLISILFQKKRKSLKKTGMADNCNGRFCLTETLWLILAYIEF